MLISQNPNENYVQMLRLFVQEVNPARRLLFLVIITLCIGY